MSCTRANVSRRPVRDTYVLALVAASWAVGCSSEAPGEAGAEVFGEARTSAAIMDPAEDVSVLLNSFGPNRAIWSSRVTGAEQALSAAEESALGVIELAAAEPDTGVIEMVPADPAPAADRPGKRPAQISPSEVEAALDRLAAAHIDETDAIWPASQYVLAEALLAQDDLGAYSAFLELAQWAARDPYTDRWGASPLATVALWRAISIEMGDGRIEVSKAAELLRIADRLLGTRLSDGLFRTPLLATLPTLEEEILHALPHLAAEAGRADEAVDRFVDYQRVATSGQMDDFERQLLDEAIARGTISRDRIDLIRARRLAEVREYPEALRLLERVWEGDDVQLGVRAGLELATFLRSYPGAPAFPRADAILDTLIRYAADPRINEEAFYQRGILGRLRGAPQAFEFYLEELLERHPSGEFGDDALYRLADHFRATNLDRSLDYFDRLRSWSGENDWIESASFWPAIALYSRGKDSDLAEAATILDSFLESYPESTLRPHAAFWAGRVSEAQGNAAAARRYFDEAIAASPFGYYGVRARMHKQDGAEARFRLYPSGRAAAALNAAYQRAPGSMSRQPTPYHEFLERAVESGLYAGTLQVLGELRAAYPARRIQELSLSELDERGFLQRLVMVLGIRQIAMAAADAYRDPANRMAVLEMVGRVVEDWPLSTFLSMPEHAPLEHRVPLQESDGYLRAAYPAEVFQQYFRQAAAAEGVDPVLLYAVVREETAFDPNAFSTQGALGLFQFVPLTLDSLSRQFKLPELADARARSSYILDPAYNISLGARWFSESLLPVYVRKGVGMPFRVALAVMEHHAGRRSVDVVLRNWDSSRFGEDLELLVEAGEVPHTRNIMRRILATMAIAEAVGLFGNAVVGSEAGATSGQERN